MIKLKKTIFHLDQKVFKSLEDTLIKNKSNNFLYLLQSYKKDMADAEITKVLNLTSNSYYVLKSRLYDKIQEHLSGDIFVNREELLSQLNKIPQMCFSEPREVATAFLLKLEKDLLKYDMHNELIIVYSALKKIHLFSEKYFHFSQLFNKHIAYSLSLEKSEEILGNFNRIFGQYNFSRLPRLLDTLLFISKDINDHYTLNPSRQIEIIKNFIELQLCIFCKTDLNAEKNVEDLLTQTERLIAELPTSSHHKSWMPALEYLFFEYYFRMKRTNLALTYYEKVNSNLPTLLLYTNVCNTAGFLISKIAFLQEQGRIAELIEGGDPIIIFDEEDIHTKVLLGIYYSMISYYSGQLKFTANKLNVLLNENSFKDYFHINTDIKLTLAFINLCQGEYGLAESITKSIYRKIKTEQINNYPNVLDLIKLFETEIKTKSKKFSQKQKDLYTLFAARNIEESELLKHINFEIKKRYC